MQGELKPNYTFWFDIEVADGIARAKKRQALDRFESEQIEFFEKVRLGYAKLASERPEQFVKINAALSIDDITLQIKAALQKFL